MYLYTPKPNAPLVEITVKPHIEWLFKVVSAQIRGRRLIKKLGFYGEILLNKALSNWQILLNKVLSWRFNQEWPLICADTVFSILTHTWFGTSSYKKSTIFASTKIVLERRYFEMIAPIQKWAKTILRVHFWSSQLWVTT